VFTYSSDGAVAVTEGGTGRRSRRKRRPRPEVIAAHRVSADGEGGEGGELEDAAEYDDGGPETEEEVGKDTSEE
jgi:hypothetical protein